MSHQFLSRNIEDGNARTGADAAGSDTAAGLAPHAARGGRARAAGAGAARPDSRARPVGRGGWHHVWATLGIAAAHGL